MVRKRKMWNEKCCNMVLSVMSSVKLDRCTVVNVKYIKRNTALFCMLQEGGGKWRRGDRLGVGASRMEDGQQHSAEEQV
jgi:hypothetical protein